MTCDYRHGMVRRRIVSSGVTYHSAVEEYVFTIYLYLSSNYLTVILTRRSVGLNIVISPVTPILSECR